MMLIDSICNHLFSMHSRVYEGIHFCGHLDRRCYCWQFSAMAVSCIISLTLSYEYKSFLLSLYGTKWRFYWIYSIHKDIIITHLLAHYNYGTYSALLALCEWNPPVTGGSLTKGTRVQTSVCLLLAWTSCWPNSRELAHKFLCHNIFMCWVWRPA